MSGGVITAARGTEASDIVSGGIDTTEIVSGGVVTSAGGTEASGIGVTGVDACPAELSSIWKYYEFIKKEYRMSISVWVYYKSVYFYSSTSEIGSI